MHAIHRLMNSSVYDGLLIIEWIHIVYIAFSCSVQHISSFHHSFCDSTEYHTIHGWPSSSILSSYSCSNMSNIPIITFSQSNKGKPVLICDGFVYHLNKSCPKVKYWRCENRLCSAVLHTDANDQFKSRNGDHSGHLSSPENIELLNFKSNVRKRVVTEATSIGRIYDEEMARAQLSQTALAIAPSANDASKCCPISNSLL